MFPAGYRFQGGKSRDLLVCGVHPAGYVPPRETSSPGTLSVTFSPGGQTSRSLWQEETGKKNPNPKCPAVFWWDVFVVFSPPGELRRTHRKERNRTRTTVLERFTCCGSWESRDLSRARSGGFRVCRVHLSICVWHVTCGEHLPGTAIRGEHAVFRLKRSNFRVKVCDQRRLQAL